MGRTQRPRERVARDFVYIEAPPTEQAIAERRKAFDAVNRLDATFHKKVSPYMDGTTKTKWTMMRQDLQDVMTVDNGGRLSDPFVPQNCAGLTCLRVGGEVVDKQR